MCGFVGGLETLDRHVSVDLCGGNTRVPKKRLHAAEIRAVVQQVRRKTVPQLVR